MFIHVQLCKSSLLGTMRVTKMNQPEVLPSTGLAAAYGARANTGATVPGEKTLHSQSEAQRNPRAGQSWETPPSRIARALCETSSQFQKGTKESQEEESSWFVGFM